MPTLIGTKFDKIESLLINIFSQFQICIKGTLTKGISRKKISLKIFDQYYALYKDSFGRLKLTSPKLNNKITKCIHISEIDLKTNKVSITSINTLNQHSDLKSKRPSLISFIKANQDSLKTMEHIRHDMESLFVIRVKLSRKFPDNIHPNIVTSLKGLSEILEIAL